MIRRPPRSTQSRSSAASDVYKRQPDAGRIYRRLLRYAAPHWGMFAIGVLGMALYAATDASTAWLVREFLNATFVERSPRALWFIPVAIVVLFFLRGVGAVSYTHLRAHETRHDLVCRLLLEKK